MLVPVTENRREIAVEAMQMEVFAFLMQPHWRSPEEPLHAATCSCKNTTLES